MAHEQARDFVERAVQAIQSAQYQQAADLADRAISLEPSDTEAHILRGVALSQLGHANEATDSFRRAIQLSPQNSKAFYNLAVHYYGLKEKERALEMAREALRIDPNHTPARELVDRIQGELGVPPSPEVPQPPAEAMDVPQPQPQPFAPQEGSYYRPGYYDYNEPVHSLRFVEALGKIWDGIGWVLSLGCMICWISYVVLLAPVLTKFMSNPSVLRTMNNQTFGPAPTLNLLVYCFVFLMIIWMIIELLDRRGNWMWLLPILFSCCCLRITWAIVPMYILFGRQR